MNQEADGMMSHGNGRHKGSSDMQIKIVVRPERECPNKIKASWHGAMTSGST